MNVPPRIAARKWLLIGIIFTATLAGSIVLYAMAGNRQELGLVIIDSKLCREPQIPCGLVTYKTSSWSGCSYEPKGCYERSFEVEFYPGNKLIAENPVFSLRKQEPEWVNVTAIGCHESDCSSGHDTGWIPRKNLVKLSDFKKLEKWNGVNSVSIYAGDFAGSLSIGKDATFSFEGSGEGEGEKPYQASGSLYRTTNFLWAKTDVIELYFVKLHLNGKDVYCWTNRGDEESCFPSPFE